MVVFAELKFVRISSREELETALSMHSWNLVIANFHSTQIEVQDALKTIQSRKLELPFIVVFDRSIPEEMVADMMKAGAADFVSKARPERLLSVVQRLQNERENKQKNVLNCQLVSEGAAKEQMLAIVSHDIKNPLSAIQLEAQMLLRVVERHGKSLLGEEVKIQAGRILKTTDRLKILISDLLDKNKSENGLSSLSRTDVVVNRLFQDVLDSLRPHLRQKNICIKSQMPPKLITLSMDRSKMFQVLSNLLSNAVKFTPAAGTITFSLEEKETECFFKVTDSGPGLQADHLPRVFDKYWTGKMRGCSGTGLGLFISKTIVEAHGGVIWAENLPEGGACFTFRIPKGPLLALKADDRPLIKGQKSVLVLDDDEDLREVVAWALTKEGYSVETYGDPKEALLALQSGRKRPQLILADYQMEGMKGGDFLRLKEQLPEVKDCPVLMVSAAPKEVEQEIPRIHYKEIITKPLDLEGLLESLSKHMTNG